MDVAGPGPSAPLGDVEEGPFPLFPARGTDDRGGAPLDVVEADNPVSAGVLVQPRIGFCLRWVGIVEWAGGNR